MADAAVAAALEKLSESVTELNSKVLQLAPKRTVGSWLIDNSAILTVGLAALIAAFNFSGRLDKLDQRLETLGQHVDGDFRTLSDKIGSLAVQQAKDEGQQATAKAAARP